MRRAIVLDTGAFIAAERWDRTLLGLIDGAAREGVDVVIPAAVVAEAWRRPARPNSAMLLEASRVETLERSSAQRIGELLGLAASAQVVDGSVADLAIRLRPSLVLTTDPADIDGLVVTAGYTSAVVPPRGEPGAKRVDVLVAAL